jgi:hypothetical protein
MKNIIKLFGIVLIVAIGFSFAACETPPPASEPDPQPAPQPEAPPPAAQPAPQPTPPSEPQPVSPSTPRSTLILDGASNYTVKKGDVLVDIAKRFYNNGYYYPVIFLANNSKIKDPDKIQPNTQIIIPNLQRNLNDTGARVIIKQALMDCVPFENSRGRNKTADGIRVLSNSL